MELKGKIAKPAPAELKALHLQCRLLVEASAASTPSGKMAAEYDEAIGRLTRMILESAHEPRSLPRLREIACEEAGLRAGIAALTFGSLWSFTVLVEKVPQHAGAGMLIEHAWHGPAMRTDESLPGNVLVSLPALAAVETILRAHGGSAEAELWKDGAGYAAAMVRNGAPGAGRNGAAASRGALLLALSENFIEAVEGGGTVADGTDGDEAGIALGRLVSAAESLPHECIAKAAETALEIAERLPLAKIIRIADGTREAAMLLREDVGSRIAKLCDELLARANFNTGFRNN